MIIVDTNVLVRILIDDEAQMEQVKLARQFAKKNHRLFVPQLVQVELIWVLESVYELSRSEIVSILKHLYENAAFVLQGEEQFEAALHSFQVSNAGFADCLISAVSNDEECQVVTFDKKFAKLQNVKLLS